MKKVFTTIIVFFIAMGVLYAQSDSVNVTFQVNMRVQILSGNFNPATDVVRAAGDFQGWAPGSAPDMVDANGDSIYAVTYKVQSNQSYQYKYLIGTAWGGDEKNNRSVTIGAKDTVLAAVYFNDDSVYVAPKNIANITFKVNMSVLQKEGLFKPDSQNVYIAGTINGWSSTADTMKNTGNYIYAITLDSLPSGTVEEFKFIYGTIWESIDNRKYTVPDTNSVYGPYFFNNDSVVSIITNGNITFSINMSVLDQVGIFDPSKDSLQVRGNFNGWSASDPTRSKMSQNPTNPDQFAVNIPFQNTAVGEQELYKYYAVIDTSTDHLWIDNWERPTSTGGGNRVIAFGGKSDQVVNPTYYDDVLPGQIVPTGKSLSITFSVDMRPAMNKDSLAIPFNPKTDTLYWVSGEPAFARTQGVNPNINTKLKIFKLQDTNGDSIYTGKYTINGPTFNAFEYIYGFVSASDGSFIKESTGFGDFAYRVRYIAMTGAKSFVQPYSAPQDHWTNQDDKSDQWEQNPLLTDVKDVNTVVNSYKLSQNYPNPFNPTTIINFSIPQNGLVTLQVYNILGQKVVTLINKTMNAGAYKVSFNASNLSSGVYLYRLRVNGFTATRKMMLLK